MLKNKGLAVGLIVLFAVVLGVFLMKSRMAPAPVETAATAPVEAPAATPAPAVAPNVTPIDASKVTPPAIPVQTATPEQTAMIMQEPPAAPAPPAVADAAAAAAAPAPALEATITAAPQGFDLKAALADRTLGREDAPVTIIEYASLTCPHCAFFATTILADVKTKLLDTGKAKLIFRDFPLDQHAMKAAKMARCAPVDKYFDLIEVIFRNQERWVKAEDPEKSVMQLGTLAGMDESTMKTCMDNSALEDGIAAGVADAQSKFTVRSTPTFVFNYGAESLSGAQPVEKFEEIVNKLTAGK